MLSTPMTSRWKIKSKRKNDTWSRLTVSKTSTSTKKSSTKNTNLLIIRSGSEWRLKSRAGSRSKERSLAMEMFNVLIPLISRDQLTWENSSALMRSMTLSTLKEITRLRRLTYLNDSNSNSKTVLVPPHLMIFNKKRSGFSTVFRPFLMLITNSAKSLTPKVPKKKCLKCSTCSTKTSMTFRWLLSTASMSTRLNLMKTQCGIFGALTKSMLATNATRLKLMTSLLKCCALSHLLRRTWKSLNSRKLSRSWTTSTR